MASHFQDPRLTLLGAGFKGDQEAQDGVHLRWSFDPDLGFPPKGFHLFRRAAAPLKSTFHVSLVPLAGQLMQQPAPAGVQDGVTVHRADGDFLGAGIRCDRRGLFVDPVPLVLRFRDSFGKPPGLVREVTLFGAGEGVFAQALHAGRVADCAATGDEACLKALGADVKGLAPKPAAVAAAAECVPFEITLRADAIDEIRLSGCDALLLGVSGGLIDPDDCGREWEVLVSPICLPVEEARDYPCELEPGGAREVASNRLPREDELPPGAPTREELEKRLLGQDFDELRRALEQALDGGGQLVERLAADDSEDTTEWTQDVVRDALTAAADPYFARILGLYWVDRLEDDKRYDYKLEGYWPATDDIFCWIAYDLGLDEQPLLPPPTEAVATARPGSAHVTFEGKYNPCEMDVVVGWRRPSLCELSDAVQSPVSYLIERTEAGAPASGPYRLVNLRAFEKGGEPEVVPAMIVDPTEGPPRFADGYYVDRGPGYGTFHYRVVGRDLFGRSSGPSDPAQVEVNDEVAPGPPLNLAAEYLDPADPERAASPVLAWANRDTPAGQPRRPAVALRWVWPASRQQQYPDLDEFRLYYRGGSLNHVLGRITTVSPVGPIGTGEYEVATDLAPVGPDVPVPQTAVDLGALRSEGEECPVITLRTVGGRLVFRVRANPAAPPLAGPVAFRLGRGTSPTATQPGRAPYAAFRSFEVAADWGGLLLQPAAPPRPLRVAAGGTVTGPLPAGLTAADVEVTRTLEPQGGGVSHWHYEVKLRGLTLTPSLARPRVLGTFGIGAVDTTGNQGRIAPPASVFALHRVIPTVPVIVYPPVNFATPADFHGISWFRLTWTGVAGIGYQVYRAGDLDLLAAAGVDPAVHRARTPDEQRLELQQIALNPARVEAFRLVTPEPLRSTGGPMEHRDPLPGEVRNRFVYRIRAIDPSGNLAPWPPAAAASCVVVDLPGVPPAAPAWADTGYPGPSQGGGVALRWTPNPEADLAGYRLYRVYDAEAAADVRSMTPLFAAAAAEGGGTVTGVLLTRDATGAVTGVTELPAGERPAGRLVQYVDTTVQAGRPVYYRLVAENAAGQRSPSSERLAVQPPKSQPPAPPVWGPATVTGGEVDLRWAAAEDDLECLLLRRTGGALWRPLAPWSAAGEYGFTDRGLAPGTTYEYRVRVRDRVGHVVDGPLLTVEIES